MTPVTRAAARDVHHVEHVLNDIEHEVVLLLKTGGRDAHRDAAISHCRTENRHSRFISRGEQPVFRSNLRQLSSEQVQELAR